MSDWMNRTPECSAQLEEMDEQERELFRRLNELLDTLLADWGKEVMEPAVSRQIGGRGLRN